MADQIRACQQACTSTLQECTLHGPALLSLLSLLLLQLLLLMLQLLLQELLLLELLQHVLLMRLMVQQLLGLLLEVLRWYMLVAHVGLLLLVWLLPTCWPLLLPTCRLHSASSSVLL